MPQLYLYWDSQPEVDRDVVEEVVSAVLGARGDVIGGGSGLGVTNLDLDLAAARPDQLLLEMLDRAVNRLGLPGAFWQWERSTNKHPVGSGLSGPAPMD